MTQLNGSVRIDLAGAYSLPQIEDGEAGGTASITISRIINQAFASGNQANQAEAHWASVGRELAENASETIDLYDFGSLDIGAGEGLDPLGQALASASVRMLLIVNHADSEGTLLIGADGTTAAWNSLFNGDDEACMKCPPGSVRLMLDPIEGLAVEDSTNHLLKMAATGGDLKYDIYVWGTDEAE